MNIDEQMANGLGVLAKILPLDPYAIIGGGAVRDWDHNISCRDIDIYFRSFASKPAEVMTQLRRLGLEALGHLQSARSDEDGYYYGIPDILAVINMSSLEGPPVQLVAIKPSKEVPHDFIQKNFDFGLCMISMDGHGRLTRSSRYTQDKKNCEYTAHLSQLSKSQIKGLPIRAAKMRKKFPDYELRLA